MDTPKIPDNVWKQIAQCACTALGIIAMWFIFGGNSFVRTVDHIGFEVDDLQKQNQSILDSQKRIEDEQKVQKAEIEYLHTVIDLMLGPDAQKGKK